MSYINELTNLTIIHFTSTRLYSVQVCAALSTSSEPATH